MIQFADDTVVYVSDKCFNTIERKLNEDLQSIAAYFYTNELIINLSKGKTESMLLGTAIKLSKFPTGLSLSYDHKDVVATARYKYLGTRINQSLNMEENFNYLYKQASNKLRMLSNLRDGLDNECSSKIYQSMILSALMYNCTTNLNLNSTEKYKLQSIRNRAERITNVPQKNIINLVERRSVLIVRKCIDGLMCDDFSNYFQFIKHTKRTRNNGYFLKIPRVKLEFARSGFFSMGVKNFNSLPIEIRQTESFRDFKKLCDTYFDR